MKCTEFLGLSVVRRGLIVIDLALLFFIISACNGTPFGTTQPAFYRPPSAVPASPTFSSPPTVEPPYPSPTPPCVDNLTFEEDLTIPDGTLVSAGQVLDKRWQVMNSGTCNWDERYRMKLIAGPEMGAPKEQALYPARSGTGLVIRIVFTAPAEPGAYRSAWQAYNPLGEPFGDPFFIEIVVQE